MGFRWLPFAAFLLVLGTPAFAIPCHVYLATQVQRAPDMAPLADLLLEGLGEDGQVVGNSTARVLGADLRPVAMPRSWAEAVMDDYPNLHAFLGSLVQEELSEVHFGKFSHPDFKKALSGGRPTSVAAIVGVGEGIFSAACVGRLKTDPFLREAPRLVVMPLVSILSRPLQDQATKVVITPNIADAIPHGFHTLSSRVSVRSANAERYDIVLLGEVASSATSAWSVEILKGTFIGQNLKKIVVHVGMEATPAWPDDESEVPSLENAYLTSGNEVLVKWTRNALPLGPMYVGGEVTQMSTGPVYLLRNGNAEREVEVRFYSSSSPFGF